MSKQVKNGDTAAKPKKRIVLSSRSRSGLFSTGVIALVIAIAVVFNVVVGQLPEGIRQFDLSQTKLYDFSDTAIEYTAAMTEDVTITVVAPEADVDSRISTFLSKYAALSDHITLDSVDSEQYPSALTEYQCDADSIVVQCQSTGRSDVISFDSVLVPNESYYYYGGDQYSAFDGEGQLTSAIDYVLNDVTYQVYTTSNHGESSFGTQAADRMTKAHFETASVSLLMDGAIPEDCDLLMINNPTADFSAEETKLVSDYLASGGKVVLTIAAAFDHPNLDALMRTYGLTMTDGYIGDSSRYYNAAQSYLVFFPVLEAGSAATEGLSEDSLALLNQPLGMTQTDPARETISVDAFMTTSEQGLAVVSEEEYTSGQYSLGVTATEETDNGTAYFTVLTTNSLTDDTIISQFGSSVVNLDVFMNTITQGFEKTTSYSSIDAKSLSTTYNTISNANLWGLLVVILLPLLTLVLGFLRWNKRRKL